MPGQGEKVGKSPPRIRQRRRHGKPRREQDRIGTTRPLHAAGLFPGQSSGWVREARASGVPDEWLPRSGAIRSLTEPGLQADWRFFSLRKNLFLRSVRSPCGPFAAAFLNLSLNLTAYEWETASRSRATLPIDAHMVPCYPKSALKKGDRQPASRLVQTGGISLPVWAQKRDRTSLSRSNQVDDGFAQRGSFSGSGSIAS